MLNSINLYCIRIKNRYQTNVHAITRIKNGDTFILFNYVLVYSKLGLLLILSLNFKRSLFIDQFLKCGTIDHYSLFKSLPYNLFGLYLIYVQLTLLRRNQPLLRQFSLSKLYPLPSL
jgi:hypothetical protein